MMIMHVDTLEIFNLQLFWMAWRALPAIGGPYCWTRNKNVNFTWPGRIGDFPDVQNRTLHLTLALVVSNIVSAFYKLMCLVFKILLSTFKVHCSLQRWPNCLRNSSPSNTERWASIASRHSTHSLTTQKPNLDSPLPSVVTLIIQLNIQRSLSNVTSVTLLDLIGV